MSIRHVQVTFIFIYYKIPLKLLTCKNLQENLEKYFLPRKEVFSNSKLETPNHMKENTLDVLFYLFDNFAEAEDVAQNREALHCELKDAGFPKTRITKAFDWLESLADDDKIYISEPKSHSIRQFSKYEARWLDQECQNYMVSLHQTGVLSSEMFERTIDRILTLGDKEFDINRLKWVILMLLLNQPDTEAEYIWMDDVALGEESPVYH